MDIKWNSHSLKVFSTNFFQTFTTDLYFRQTWQDYRLRHNAKTVLTPLLGRKIPTDFIWTPDTVISNSVKTRKHKVTTNNEKLDIYPNGTVFWGSRYFILEEKQCPEFSSVREGFKS